MSFFHGLIWQQPAWLLLLLLLPLLLRKPRSSASLTWPASPALPTLRTRLMPLPKWLMALAAALVIVALARPQRLLQDRTISTKGIDIGLVLDVSESMLAEDFRPNRLEASKRVAMNFVDRRPNDRFSVTIFAGEAFSPCPLTTDQRIVKEIIAGIRHGVIRDNTAIGDGLATAINRLKDSPAESKVIILLTDGENNAGYIQPMVAAEIAQTLGIRLYTIGAGAAWQFDESPVDETLLTEMARITGGRYFRAQDAQALEQIYAEIDRLETTEIETTTLQETSEAFRGFAWAALALISLGLLLQFTVLRTIP